MQTATCKLCNQEKPIENFHRENGKVRKYLCYACRGKRERAQAKIDLLEAFDGKCMCCGEDNPLFLTLQHIGGKDKSQIGLMSHQLYARAKKEGWPKDKYELLCMNCNFADGHFGICPHRSGRTTDMVWAELRDAAQLIVREYKPLNDAQKAGLAKGHEISHVFGRAGKPPDDGVLMKLIQALIDIRSKKG